MFENTKYYPNLMFGNTKRRNVRPKTILLAGSIIYPK